MAFMALTKGEALKPIVPMHWFASEALKTYNNIISNHGSHSGGSCNNDGSRDTLYIGPRLPQGKLQNATVMVVNPQMIKPSYPYDRTIIPI